MSDKLDVAGKDSCKKKISNTDRLMLVGGFRVFVLLVPILDLKERGREQDF